MKNLKKINLFNNDEVDIYITDDDMKLIIKSLEIFYLILIEDRISFKTRNSKKDIRYSYLDRIEDLESRLSLFE